MLHVTMPFTGIFKSRLLCMAIAALLFSMSCNSPEKSPADKKPLSDAEKHLPENALRGLQWPDDLDITLFAHEPMLINPTNMDIDEKGRVWVCEGYNYRYTLHPDNPYNKAGDRIMVIEDADGDGKADKETVFYQGEDINSALGIAVLGNKVIVSRSPDVFVFTDNNDDGVADKKDTLFTGIGGTEHDHAIHAFNFGPDGKLYFNFGNEGAEIKDKNGNIVKDIYGNEIKNDGKPWRQGMIFRCDTDGKNIEVLGNNFRNPYEVTEDSYGTLWQSDNDDDGNRGVRINYVMQYGNYGFKDEMTGASWPERRINIEDSIPFRHWHLNDPGVVPNMLQNGAGSPTGILVYEGDLLPERFHNQLIHCDAGPNVVRSYAVSPDGAGYKATIHNIAEGTGDTWFRPSDVCVAPDGSVMIADWYDPGVGGHNIGDFKKGRIFRVTPAGHTKYSIPPMDLSTAEGAVQSLKNPNRSTRYLAWQKLHSMGAGAAPALEKLFHSDNSRYRARALWLLSKIPESGITYIHAAIKDKDPNIRITALRAGLQIHADTLALVNSLVNDADIQVRREAALALHHCHAAGAAGIWAQLAKQYDGKDRWYLEALGIGADQQWDSFLPAWLHLIHNEWNTTAGRDIVWRARTNIALSFLAKIISDPGADPHKQLKFFRAFDFYKGAEKQKTLLALLNANHPQQDYIDAITVLQLDAKTPQTAILQKAINNGLKYTEGSQTYIDIVRKYGIRGKDEELLAIAEKNKDEDTQADAIRLLLETGGTGPVKNILFGSDTAEAKKIITLLAKIRNEKAERLLQQFITDTKINSGLRIQTVKDLTTGRAGETALLALVKSKKLPDDLIATATEIFSKSHRKDLREEAAKYLALTNTTGNLPPVSQMLAVKGNADSGRIVFTTYCAVCHQVKGNGTTFGPDLSEIGSKLPPEALYTAIMKPSEGISFGFDGYTFTLKDGTEIAGYIASETADEMSIKMIGGITEKHKKTDIIRKIAMQQSLMPEGLAEGMGAAQMENLVAYLSQLKKK